MKKPKDFISIAKLAYLSGASRSTIHHYLMVGIVPEPIRTSKNMAYYDPASVEIIKVAKELRSRNIPISSVKDILHKYGAKKTNELLTQSKDITLTLLGPLKPPHSK